MIKEIIMSFMVATSHASVDEIKDFREQEAQCLAKNMYFEARNQGTAGIIAVSNVVSVSYTHLTLPTILLV